MNDLHERLTAAVTERLTYARPAQLISTTPELTAMIVAYCERDLKVLERHSPFEQRNWSLARGSFTEPGCEHCELTSNDGEALARDWPCDDIRVLATAYGVDVDDA